MIIRLKEMVILDFARTLDSSVNEVRGITVVQPVRFVRDSGILDQLRPNGQSSSDDLYKRRGRHSIR
jgi:hypothetical protein